MTATRTETDPTASSAPNVTPLAARITEGLAGRFRVIPVLLTLVVIWVVFQSQNSRYLTFGNITNLALQIITTAVLALGLVFVLLVSEIDLSSAALSGVAATFAANQAVNHGWPLGFAVAAAIALAVVVMLIQAAVVVYGVPSLIVTLGGMVILQGLLLVVLPSTFTVSVGGTSYAQLSSLDIPTAASFAAAAICWLAFCYMRTRQHASRRRSRAESSLLRSVLVPGAVAAVPTFGVVAVLTHGHGLPLPVVILAGMMIGAWYITTQTRYGLHLFAVGGDREAAQRAGIPVGRIIVYSFLILGVCAAMAGILDAARLLSVSNASGSGSLMLNAIAAAVVGGTSLFGGRGSVWSALLGALVIGSINNGVQLLGISTQVQDFATGGVLIVAVAIDIAVSRGSLLPRHV